MPNPVTTGERSPLAPRECRVWWATIADCGPHLEALLSAVEEERRGAYLRADDRRRFATAAALLRLAAAGVTSADPREVRVDRRCERCGAQHAKTRLLDHPDLDASISHAGDHVAVALARGPRVGVDVERIGDADVGDLARTAFSPAEAAALADLEPDARRAAFYRLWTTKESIVKALGTGITDGFAEVSAATTGADVHELACAPGYVATLAIIGRCDRVSTVDGAALLRGAAAEAPPRRAAADA